MTAKQDHELDKLRTHARFLNSKFPRLSVLRPHTSDDENSAIYIPRKKYQRDCTTELFVFFFLQGILGYNRYINAVGDAEFNLILMDYRESNNSKLLNRPGNNMI